MGGKSHKQIRDLFEAALARPASQRRSYLEKACGGDSRLLEEVESLLRAHEEDEGFLASPVADRALNLLARRTADQDEPSPPPLIGRTFGPYLILRKLGQGGMGEVYLAQEQGTGRSAALKLLSRAQQTNPLLRKRFLREAKAAADLHHPGICAILSHGSFQERDFIAMEYLEGLDLKEKLESGPLPVDDALLVFRQLAEALEHAHRRGVLHRDLKPANVMLTRGGGVKILDFGAVKLIPDDAGAAPETMTQLTIEGSAIGTLAYMSPEQLRGLPVDVRTDVFALGVLVYEMLTGVHPFRRVSRLHTASAIFGEDPPSLTEVSQTIPRFLDQLVHAMLEKDPMRRPASMNRVLRELARLSARLTPARFFKRFFRKEE